MQVVLRTFQAVALGVVLSSTVCSVARSADIPPRLAISTDALALSAVDGINGKVSGFGGASDGRAFYGGEGSFTVPLGHQFGFQFDGLVAGANNRFQGDVTVTAAAGHLFWRDPAVGLLGAYGHYFHADAFSGVNSYATAAEGAFYRGRFTLEGVAGVDGGRVDFGFLGSRNIATRFFDAVQFSYYPTDNLKLSVGHSYGLGTHAILFGAEHGFPTGGGTMAALYAQVRVADGDTAALGGLRVYFGQRDKTLIRRHREDDPPGVNWASIYGFYFSVLTYISVYGTLIPRHSGGLGGNPNGLSSR